MSYRVTSKIMYDRWQERLNISPVPMCDEDAWLTRPDLRWCFNKLILAEDQGVSAAPHGIVPDTLPVFSKPIYNLLGCSTGAQVLYEWRDKYYQPGHFWMENLSGPQVSYDIVLRNGIMMWAYCMKPEKAIIGSFVGWETCAVEPDTHYKVCEFIQHHLQGYTGVFNFELIGDVIIEAHPRCASEFLDFFGEDWLDAVEYLQTTGDWHAPGGVKSGYQAVWRVLPDRGSWIPKVDLAKVKELEWNVYGIFLPFLEGQRLEVLNPDQNGSYRIALVSAASKQEALNTIDQLKELIT